MGNVIKFIGNKYGKIVVLSSFRADAKNPKLVCLCECGKKRTYSVSHFYKHPPSHCGCLCKKRIPKKVRIKRSGTKEHRAWMGIRMRCFNIFDPGYRNYGGRGITVCSRWLESFDNFLSDMGRAPSSEYSLDRIDNNGNYEPGNCRWATAKQQANNKRNNKKPAMKSLTNKFLIVNNGVTLTEHIDPVIFALDSFFEVAGVKSKVTSALRGPEDQLRIIRSALVNNRIADQYQEAFNEITSKTIYEGEEVYSWQPGWSKLLNIGFIVNPPYTAKVLMDYYRPGSPENRKGRIIGQSPHTKGTAFDIGGGPNGLNDELAVVKSAMGKVKGLKGYLLERNNNCLHVDCAFIDMENYV